MEMVSHADMVMTMPACADALDARTETSATSSTGAEVSLVVTHEWVGETAQTMVWLGERDDDDRWRLTEAGGEGGVAFVVEGEGASEFFAALTRRR